MSAAQVAQATQSDEQQTTLKGTVVNASRMPHQSRARLLSRQSFRHAYRRGRTFEFALPSNGQNFTGEFFEGGQSRQQSSFAPAASFSFMARKPGFFDDPDDRRQPETTSGSEITIPLMPEDLIKGRVISSEADPPSGIRVQLFSGVCRTES